MTAPLLGVVADDLTGACDVADAVADAGLSAVVICGVPRGPLPDCDCAVVALKSRTAPVSTAVAESVAAARALLAAGCATLYQKYCSTFDSTDQGNIGPVADALLDASGAALCVGTPATPRAGRTVYQGRLFVGRQLLSESPMRDHPLTPMRESDLVAVLGRQTARRVHLLPRETVASGADRVATHLAAAVRDGVRHVIADALDEADLDSVAAGVKTVDRDGVRVVAAGAAGLAAAFARTSIAGVPRRATRARPSAADGRRLVVSGSCSAATRAQVAAFRGPTVELQPVDVAADPSGTVQRVIDSVAGAYAAGAPAVLVSSTAEPAAVAATAARLGAGRAAELLEAAAAEIARRAVAELDVRRLLVAGGETSGAVVQALGLTQLRVGPAVAPGLPWMLPTGDTSPAVLLKSGNFGAPELFDRAWSVCG